MAKTAQAMAGRTDRDRVRRMLQIDLTHKRALVVGVADDRGFGFAIAKALATAGASVCVGTWPPALRVFNTALRRGKFDESLRMPDGNMLEFERIYPFDAEYDTMSDVPEEVCVQKRYRECGDFTTQGLAARLKEDFGDRCLDIVVHSLANGPEVDRPLMQTTRQGYLAAHGASAYSFVSLAQNVQPLMRSAGSFVGITYLAGQRVVPSYGGGMASAKAALEIDTRMLAFEMGRRWRHRVNVISAGPYASRAASAIGQIETMIQHYEANAPLGDRLLADEVAYTVAFLCSPLASGITGTIVYVDKGYHAMATPAEPMDLVAD